MFKKSLEVREERSKIALIKRKLETSIITPFDINALQLVQFLVSSTFRSAHLQTSVYNLYWQLY